MFRERFISSLIASAFFLAFRPFGFDSLPNEVILHLSLCVLCSAVCLFSEVVLRYVLRFPNDYSRGTKYVLKRNIYYQAVNTLLLTVFICWYLDRFCSSEEVDNHFSWHLTLWVFGTICCCTLIIGLYWRNVFAKREYLRQLKDAEYLNGVLEERQRQSEKYGAKSELASSVGTTTDSIVQLVGATKESLTLDPKDFVYAESDANYVRVYYYKEGAMTEAMLRTSITLVEECFKSAANILRCHRAFVVNLDHVSQLESQDHALLLTMRGTNSKVPVSKTHVQEVRECILRPAV